MRKMNEMDLVILEPYEKDFERAIKSRYCTGLSKEELEVVSAIYRQTLNRQANLSCGGCVLQMMTSVGRLYFSLKDKLKEEQAKVQEEVKEEIKPKKRRRKKNEDKTED